jgi:hypothetical protein
VADQQGNTTPDAEQGSPFARPAFLVAAVLVLVIVLLGVVVAVRVSRSSDAVAPPISTPSQVEEPSPTPRPTDPATSVCGLAGVFDSGTVTEAPAAAWQYEDTTAYPTSPEFGPGKNGDEGFRYCFQHTPTGALFATANALAQGTSTDVAKINAWASYFVSKGSGRQDQLDQLSQPRTDGSGVRMTIVGFKVLAYSADSARVDLGVQTSGNGQTLYASFVYELTWQEGDWKLNSDAPTPFNFATVPSTDSYVPWGA